MRKINSFMTLTIGLVAILFVAAPARMQAQFPQGGQPPYLHAIADLRASRAWIHANNREDVQGHLHHATDEISKAIDEIKHAAADDGRDLNYDPPVDARGMAAGPLHEGMRLLDQARRDIMEGQDDRHADKLRERSLRHIDEAHSALEHAMEILGHP